MAGKGGQIGGQGGPVKRGAWLFIACCIVVAVWNGMFTSPAQFVDNLKANAEKLQQFVSGLVSDVENGEFPSVQIGGDGGTGGAGSALPPSEASSALNLLRVTNSQASGYNRDEWRHWDNVGTSCWNVREEVLVRDAQPGSVTLLDVNKQPTADKAAACYVSGGTWIDPYTGQTFTNPEDLDIDHVVPLSAAAVAGGQSWSSDRKQDYANDLTNPSHLRAVSASANRSKGDQTPATWKPTNEAAWCDYAVSWVGVKKNWNLTVNPDEKTALEQMLATC